MAVFATVLCTELGISDVGYNLFAAWFMLPLSVFLVIFVEPALWFGLAI